MVIIAASAALVGGIVLGRRFLTGRSPLQKKVVLTAEMKPEEGYVSHPQIEPELVGRTALVMAVLRPSGRVMVDGRYYDAAAEDGLFVARGRTVTVTRIEGGVPRRSAKRSKNPRRHHYAAKKTGRPDTGIRILYYLRIRYIHGVSRKYIRDTIFILNSQLREPSSEGC